MTMGDDYTPLVCLWEAVLLLNSQLTRFRKEKSVYHSTSRSNETSLSRNNTTLLRAIQQFSVIVSDVPNIFADLKRFHLISREWPQ